MFYTGRGYNEGIRISALANHEAAPPKYSTLGTGFHNVHDHVFSRQSNSLWQDVI
jgi:hypothetical protein